MMQRTPKNTLEFKVYARYALFTDPVNRVGGEKCSYHVPTYEAIKGVLKSIYWKPTIIWVVDEVRVVKRIRTQTKGTKPLNYGGGNDLATYTFLVDVEYQVRAHFVFNLQQHELESDRNGGKHFAIAKRSLDRGGRQDIFLGTRDCQAYVEPCEYGAGPGHYDDAGELGFGLMFHGFDYPDETGDGKLHARFWRPTMINGVIKFAAPESENIIVRKFIREMIPKQFGINVNACSVENEFIGLEE